MNNLRKYNLNKNIIELKVRLCTQEQEKTALWLLCHFDDE